MEAAARELGRSMDSARLLPGRVLPGGDVALVLHIAPEALGLAARSAARFGLYLVPAEVAGTYWVGLEPPELPEGAPDRVTCPACQRTSHHPLDVIYGWCANCGEPTSPPLI